MSTICSLNGSWQGSYKLKDQELVQFEGSVPGCAHTDLLKKGLIKDPYWEYNSKDCQFIEEAVFEYSREFEFEGDAKDVFLRFECLDTFCDIWLNEHHLGFCNNMFIPWKFNVEKELNIGKNMLLIRFYPPKEQVKDCPEYEASFTTERINIRRMQCTFGWDWIERLVTMGISGNVELYKEEKTEIDRIYIATNLIDDYGAELDLQIDFSKVGSGTKMYWSIIDPQGKCIWKQCRALAEDGVRQMVSIENPQLWWPNTYGEQPLYRLKVVIVDENEKNLGEKETPFGIRTIRILEIKDEEGSDNWNISKDLQKHQHIAENDFNEEFYGFQVLVNGKKVFCQGANWVPSEPFVSAYDEKKVNELLTLAKEANITMLRVWGGGMIETDMFYDTCDRLGIMVMQDFLMACGQYPEDKPEFIAELRKEAEAATKRISNHPSLAWWNGDNENSFDGRLDLEDYRGRKAAGLGSEPMIRRYDPYRRFMPSSPFGGTPYKSMTSGTSHSTMHVMWQFGYFKNSDLTDYRTMMDSFLARFNSEIPIFGAPSDSSLKRFLSEEKMYDDECLEFHTKNNPVGLFKEFTLYMGHKTFAEKLLGKFKNDEDKLFKMRALQYEWARYTLELYRSHREYTGGALFWMYNDCWPSDSWAIVDYYTNPKGGWYAMKNCCSKVIGSIDIRDGKYAVIISNDRYEKAKGTAKVSLWNVHSDIAEKTIELQFDVSGVSSETIYNLDWDVQDEDYVILLDVKAEGQDNTYRTTYFPKRIADLHLATANGEGTVKVVEQGDDYITVKACKYTHMVDLDGDYVFEDNYFTMLPGETRTIKFRKTLLADNCEIKVYTL